MKQTRHNIFETNSSSTHCLSISVKKDFEKDFDLTLNKNDEIEVDGWDQIESHVAYGFYDKLSYMLTWMYLRDNENPYWTDRNEFDDFVYPSDYVDSAYDYDYDLILEAIQKHFPQVKGLRLTNIENITWDHQTMPYESSFVIDFIPEQIEGYLFNDDVFVTVGRD